MTSFNPTPPEKQILRNKIAEDLRAFRRAGGKIERLPTGEVKASKPDTWDRRTIREARNDN